MQLLKVMWGSVIKKIFRMKLFLIFIISILTFLKPAAQDINAVVKEAERLENLPDEKAALIKFKEALKIKPTHIHAFSICLPLCYTAAQFAAFT